MSNTEAKAMELVNAICSNPEALAKLADAVFQVPLTHMSGTVFRPAELMGVVPTEFDNRIGKVKVNWSEVWPENVDQPDAPTVVDLTCKTH